MTQEIVRVDLPGRAYDIVIASGHLARFSTALGNWFTQRGEKLRSGRTALVVTDTNVARPHAEVVQTSLATDGWRCETVVLEPGEQTKALTHASRLYDRLVDMKADRHTVVVAVGGGVVGDLAGFAAATYARGIPFAQVPTTLLAQVDSSVGGKVGINHPQGKNLIGAFYQPFGVFIDTTLLDTLPPREFAAGMAEVVKYGVILDAELFEELERDRQAIAARNPAVLRRVIARCCRLKADVVEQDEFERTGLRAVLNYGHTFGHALESLSDYGVLLHGEAVSLGMIAASRLAERLGRIEAAVTERQRSLLAAFHLPIALTDRVKFPVDVLLDRMRLDKKTVAGRLRFVLPNRLGHVEVVDDVDERLVRDVLESW